MEPFPCNRDLDVITQLFNLLGIAYNNKLTLIGFEANIFVGFHESRLFDNTEKPGVYFRYFDDTFVIFGSELECDRFHENLKLLYLALKFTVEKEQNNSLNFLDVSVEKEVTGFLTNVYWSIHPLEFLQPKARKSSLIKTKKIAFQPFKKVCLVYKFSCQCEARYIGRTTQRLADRIKHVPTSIRKKNNTKREEPPRMCKNSNPKMKCDSAIGQHLIKKSRVNKNMYRS